MTRSSAWFLLALMGLIVLQADVHPAASRSDKDGSGVIHIAATNASSIDTGYARAVARLDPTDSYRLALLKIKGHLSVARSLLQVRATGADYHLRKPVRTTFQGIAPQLDERDAPLTEDTLTQLERATDAAPQAALAVIDSVASAVDGSFAQAGPLRPRSALALSEALLRRSVQLYADSVVDNEVTDLRGYQTGRGYAVQAEALVRHSSGIKGKPGHERLLAAVILIRQAWPGVRPPPIVLGPQSVADHLEEALNAMQALR